MLISKRFGYVVDSTERPLIFTVDNYLPLWNNLSQAEKILTTISPMLTNTATRPQKIWIYLTAMKIWLRFLVGQRADCRPTENPLGLQVSWSEAYQIDNGEAG